MTTGAGGGHARCEAPHDPAVKCAGRPEMLVMFEFPQVIRGPIDVRMCRAHWRQCRTWRGYQGATAIARARWTAPAVAWAGRGGRQVTEGASWLWSELTKPRRLAVARVELAGPR